MDHSSATSGSVHRCIHVRMELPHIEWNTEARSLVKSVPTLPYQHQGDGGDMDSTTVTSTSKEDIDLSSFRQQDSYLLSEQRMIIQIHSSLVMDPFNSESVRIQRMVSNNSSCERDQQHSDKHSIQGSSNCEGDMNCFQWILSLIVRPQVDLFSTRKN